MRADSEVFESLRRWSKDELRSVNGQIEFLLRRALQEAGRLWTGRDADASPNQTGSELED